MAAVGYGSLPISVSLRGIQAALQKELGAPVEAAAKKAGKAIEDNLSNGAKNAQVEIEKATRFREQSVQKLTAAEQKLADAKERSVQAQRNMQAAELDYERVVTASKAKVAKAQADYDRLLSSSNATVEQVKAAEQKLADVSLKAKSDQLKAQNKLDKANSSAAKSSEAVKSALEGVATAEQRVQKATDDLASATARMGDKQEEAAAKSSKFSDVIERSRSAMAGAASKVGELAQKYQVHATVALGGITAMAKGMTDYAAEAEQSYGAVESVFKGHADRIVAESKRAADNVGISGKEYRELASVTGAMLKNMGLSMDETTDTTQRLVTVGADLAATYGGTTREAMEAIGSLLRGETDPIERYGVSIREADISARLAAEGLGKLEGEAAKQAKAQVLLKLLTEQTADAQGQFARETGTAANAAEKARAKYEDTKETLGTALLPVMTQVYQILGKVAEAASKHPKIFLAIAGAVAGLAGTTIVIAQISTVFTALSTAAATAGKTVGALVAGFATTAGIVLAWVAAIAAVGVALWAFFTKTETGKALWDKLVEAFKAGWDWIKDVFLAGWDFLIDKLSKVKEVFELVTGVLFRGDFKAGNILGIEEDSKIVDWLFQIRDAVIEVKNILFNGEFSGKLFGLEEDSTIVNWLFNIRDTFIALRDGVSEFAQTMLDKLQTAWQAVQPYFQWLADFVSDQLLAVLSNLWVSLTSLGDAFLGIATGLIDGLTPILQGLWGALKGLWDLISPVLLPALGALGAIIGGALVGAFMLLVGAVRVVSEIVKVLSDGLAWFVSNVLSPLLGVIGQVAGALLSVLGAAFSSVWEIIKTVFNGIVEVAKWATTILLTVVITPIKLAWDLMAWGIKAAWENVIQPTWVGMKDLATWLWESALKPIFDLIGTAWQVMTALIQVAWETKVKPTWQAISDMIGWLYNNILKPIFQGIIDAWGNVANFISSAWNDYIKPTWERMGELIGNIVDNWVKPAFGRLGDGLNTLKGWFNTAVDAIGSLWDTLRAKVAKPINFVIDSVYNNGIRKVWEAVSDFVGLDKKLPHIPTAAYASGGVLPGYTPGKDVHDFISPTAGRLQLSGGEAIMRPEWVRAVGGKPAIDEMNMQARRGGVSGVRKAMMEREGRYAKGGVLPTMAFGRGGVMPGVPVYGPVVPSIVALIQRFFPDMWVTSTHRPGHAGHHGVNEAVDFSDGYDTTPGMQAAARFFYTNYGKGLAELIHYPLRGWQNIENGQPFDFGAATNAGHRDHVHIASRAALPAPGKEFAGIITEGGFSGGAFAGSLISTTVDKILNPISEKIPEFGGMIGEFPKAAFNWLKEKFVNKITEAAGSFLGSPGVSGQAESWREMIIAAYKRQGYEPVPAEIDAWVRQIQTESQGDPNAVQQIVDINGTGESAGVGLLQIIPSTWAANRDPELPDNRKDPWANINGAIRYGKRRYGDNLLNVIGHGHGYAKGGVLPDMPAKLYDTGGILHPNSIAVNLSGKPEAVLTDAQWETLREVATELKLAFTGRGKGFTATGILIGDEALAKQIGALTTALGDFLGTSAKSVKAMEEYQAALESNEDNSKAVEEAEKELAEARKEAAEAAEKGGEVSKSATRKVEDAEAALAKARQSGKADKIADAEKKLARAREDLADAQEKANDKSEKSTTKSTDKVAAAEKKLEQARKKQADQAKKLEQAEMAVLAARLETAYDIYDSAAKGISKIAESYADLVGVLAAVGESVEAARQAVSGFTLEVAQNRIALVEAALALQIAEFDLQKTRINGAISVAEAQANLEKAQRASIASTYDAFGFAINRYREAGLDAWGNISDGAIVRTQKVRIAEAELARARAQSMLDQHLAQERVRAASQAAALAALNQQKSSILLAASTERLEAYAARLYGLSGSEGTAAQRGASGLAKGVGGLLGVLGGGAAAVIAGMTGNIPGAIAGGLAAVQSLGALWTGFKEYHVNKDETNKALKGLSTLDKVGAVLGVLGGAATIGGGAYLATEGKMGADVLLGGTQIGTELISSTLGSIATNIQTDMARIELDYKIRSEKLEQEYEAKKNALETEGLAKAAESAVKTAELQAIVDLAEINKRIAESGSKQVVEELKRLADITEANRDAAVQLHTNTIRDLSTAIADAHRLAAEAEARNRASGGQTITVDINIPGKTSYTAEEVALIVQGINSAQNEMEIRLREIEEKEKASALSFVNSVRQ